MWDDRGPGHLRFEGEGGEGAPPLGFISEHGVIHSALFDRARELEEEGIAEIVCPAQASKAEITKAPTALPLTYFWIRFVLQ